MRRVHKVQLRQCGKSTSLSFALFSQLDGQMKSRLIRNRRIAFLDSEGSLVPMSDAVEQLYQAWRERLAAPEAEARPTSHSYLRLKPILSAPVREEASEDVSGERPIPHGARGVPDGELTELKLPDAAEQLKRGLPLRIFAELEDEEHLGIVQSMNAEGLVFRSRSRYRPGERLLLGWSLGGSDEETWVRATVDNSSGSEDASRPFACSASVVFDIPRSLELVVDVPDYRSDHWQAA